MNITVLLTLTIQNYTLAERLELDFKAGTSAITGETGAGKSLVLDALGMALGDRADSDTIRHGADSALVAAQFDLTDLPEACQWLEEREFGTNECLLRRSFSRDGRSKGYINGQPATMGQLKELGELLLEIHGQHEHHSLLKRESQRQLLDNFGGYSELLDQVQKAYRAWHSAQQQLTAREANAAELAERAALLRFQIEELTPVALNEEEYSRLENEHAALANAEQIIQDSQRALMLCEGGDKEGIRDSINRAISHLKAIKNPPLALQTSTELLHSALIQVEESSHEISSYIDHFEADPERLAQLDRQLGELHSMARKYRRDPIELQHRLNEISEELSNCDDSDEALEVLRNSVAKNLQLYTENASKLSRKRQIAAKKLSKMVNQQLAALAMPEAVIQFELQPLEQPSSHGSETVELLIVTNAGQPPKSLQKIASGGELSRVSLAIQVSAADQSGVPTLLFDEVDVGIGGATADVVGQLLRGLGERGQVISVTHQAQVAARAHHHFVASKSQGFATMISLNDEQRGEELARMLGGAKITQQTLAHANEMLQLANSE